MMQWQQKQTGAALLVSLIILLVLSIIGISAMRGGLLQTLMAANQQQDEMSFSAADSGVSAMLVATNQEGTVDGTILGTKASEAIGGDPTEYGVAADGGVALAADPMPIFDEGRDTPITTVSVDLTYTACNNPTANTCVGYSLKSGTGAASGVGCHKFRMDSTGNVGDASTQVSQWVEAPAAKCL